VKVVAVEPLTGGRTRQAFYSTDADASAQEILERYARRWAIEPTFRDAKSRLGFEDPQGWSRRAARRTAPLADARLRLDRRLVRSRRPSLLAPSPSKLASARTVIVHGVEGDHSRH
jgi:hypothetical protein